MGLPPPPCVVIGLQNNGLGVCRSFVGTGVRVFALDRPGRSPYLRTRHATFVPCADVTGAGLIDALVELGRRLNERAVLIPTMDQSVLLVSEHRAAIEPYYRHSLPSDEQVRRLMSKSGIDDFARAHNIRVPRTVTLSATSELQAAIEHVGMPCILKPEVKTPHFVAYSPRKAFFVHTVSELQQALRLVTQWVPRVVAQEWIPGPDANLIFSLFYFGANGTPLGVFTGRKIRQYIPYCGTACSAEPCEDPVVEAAGMRFFLEANYRGFGAIEFKRTHDGDYVLMEPTVGRTEHLFALAAANGVNLAYTGYCDMAGLPLPEARQRRRRVKYVHVSRDWKAACAYMRAGELGPGGWWRSLRGPRLYPLLSVRDPGPILYQLVHKATRRPGRVARRLASRTRELADDVAFALAQSASPACNGSGRLEPTLQARRREAIEWICRAHDAGRGGVARGYSLDSRRNGSSGSWQLPYPETTGYIIPTLLACAESERRNDLARRALQMADWELEVQRPDGGIPGGVHGPAHLPVVFNTGMVMQGWCSAFEFSGSSAYADALRRAGEFLLACQDEDGAWRRHASVDGVLVPHAYDVLVSWALLRAARALGREDFRAAAAANVRFTLGLQRSSGWFAQNGIRPKDNASPLTHTIGYTLQGLWESGRLLQDEACERAVRLAATRLGELMRHDGHLPGKLDGAWRPVVSWSCLTGTLQIGLVWAALAERDGGHDWTVAARRAFAFVAGTQDMASDDAGRRGGICGSHPPHQAYGRDQVLNWATKYFVDLSLALEALPTFGISVPADSHAGDSRPEHA